MSPVRLRDLGPKARAQVEAAAAVTAKSGFRSSARPSRRSAAGTMTAKCQCGAILTSEGALDRHPKGGEHLRVEILNVEG